MKKNLLFALLVLLTSSFLAGSCSKDKEKDYSDPKNLAGTTWKYQDPGSAYYALMKFTGTSTVEVHGVEPDGTQDLEWAGSFSIAGNTITFIMDDENYIGLIDGERITINDDGEVIVFIKQ